MASQAIASIAAHEKVCAERWKQTSDTMSDIKRILAWGTAGLIGSMGTLIMVLVTHHYPG